MYINNLKIQEDDIEIGLLNLNNDEIPELIVKNSKKLYKIFSINKESKTVETIVKNEEINTIQLIYDYNSKNYMYGFITKKEPKKTKIFNQDIKTITQLDNSTDEYAMNNITVLENLEECVNKKIKSTDTTENIQKIFEETKKSYKTTDDYLKEKNSNIEDIVETTRNEVIEEKNKNI